MVGDFPLSAWEDQIYCLRFPCSLSIFYFRLPSQDRRMTGRMGLLLGQARTPILFEP